MSITVVGTFGFACYLFGTYYNSLNMFSSGLYYICCH
jgi:hypothetical protein